MNDIPIFINSIRFLQQLNNSIPFTFYQQIHKSIVKLCFRKCAVCILFRIHFTESEIIKTQQRKTINSEILTFINNKSNYFNNLNGRNNYASILDISKVNVFLSQYSNTFQIDALFIKRTETSRDRYSGHVAFPGGKHERTDTNEYQTAIREAKEEIGIDLNKNELPIISTYLGPSPNFEVTIDFKNYVSSHLFLLFDFFKECEKEIKLSQMEVSNVFFVPLNFFLDLTDKNNLSYIKPVKSKVCGKNIKISKLILNNNENFLIYGMTLRMFLQIFNLQKNVIKYHQAVSFESKFSLFLYHLCLTGFNFFTSPFRCYTLLKRIFLLCLIYYIITRLKVKLNY